MRGAASGTSPTLKLAVEERPGVWRLADGWKESLVRLGQQNDRIERLYPIVGEKAAEYRFVDPKLPLSTFEAVVIGKGLHDELSGQMFVAAQGSRQPGLLHPASTGGRGEPAAGRQDPGRVHAEKWLKPADQIIARVARENGGVYDPRQHQRELEKRPGRRPEEAALSPADLVREMFAGSSGSRRMGWPARCRTVDGVSHPIWSPSWSRGNGRILGSCSRSKRPCRHSGSRPRRPSVTWKRSGSRSVRWLPNGSGLPSWPIRARFSGQLVPAPAGPSGTEYVQVVDYRHGQLALVPKPKEAELLRGRVVTISRDPAGRLSIRSSPEISR